MQEGGSPELQDKCGKSTQKVPKKASDLDTATRQVAQETSNLDTEVLKVW